MTPEGGGRTCPRGVNRRTSSMKRTTSSVASGAMSGDRAIFALSCRRSCRRWTRVCFIVPAFEKVASADRRVAVSVCGVIVLNSVVAVGKGEGEGEGWEAADVRAHYYS